MDHLPLLGLVSDREEDIQKELFGQGADPRLKCNLKTKHFMTSKLNQ